MSTSLWQAIYLNQCWLILKRTPKNKFQWNLKIRISIKMIWKKTACKVFEFYFSLNNVLQQFSFLLVNSIWHLKTKVVESNLAKWMWIDCDISMDNIVLSNSQGAVSIRKTVLPGMAIPMLKIRRPLGRLIFNMGIAIPGKTVFLIETAPRSKDVLNKWKEALKTEIRIGEMFPRDKAILPWTLIKTFLIIQNYCGCGLVYTERSSLS